MVLLLFPPLLSLLLLVLGEKQEVLSVVCKGTWKHGFVGLRTLASLITLGCNAWGWANLKKEETRQEQQEEGEEEEEKKEEEEEGR